MKTLSIRAASALGVFLMVAVTAPAQEARADKPAGKKTDQVFGLTKLHDFHLELSAKEWEKMQPAMGFPGFGFPGMPKKEPEKPVAKGADVHKGGSFGIDFPWAHGTLSAAGRTFKDVGVRYKGGGSYLPSIGKLKRNLKIELDRYAEHRFHGLKTITLNSGVTDASRLREALAYAVYRAAGVPAPRTAFAQVTLTVPGKYDKEHVGLYTFVEHVDRTFLKDRFKNGKGLLLKPERRPGVPRGPFDYVGEDWEKYKTSLGPKHEPTKEEAQRVIAFLRLLHQPDDEKFHKEVGSYLDVDEFLRFLAGTALVCNLDSIFTIGHNCLIYLNPETNKLVFIPWDLDLSFGAFFPFGSAEQQAALSVTHPYAGENKLVDRLFASKKVKEKYQQIVKELTSTAFAKEKLMREIDAVEKALREPLEREKKAAAARKEGGGFGFPPMMGAGLDLRTFVAKRTEGVADQLAGKSEGYVPRMGFGPGGFGGGPPGGGFGPPAPPGQILSGPVQDRLKLTGEQRREIERLQKELDASLSKVLTPEQRKLLQQLREQTGRPGGFPGAGRPGGGFPGGPMPPFELPPRKEP
jgi:spore coat protein CotH